MANEDEQTDSGSHWLCIGIVASVNFVCEILSLKESQWLVAHGEGCMS